MAAINVVRKRSREIFAGRNKLEFDYWLLLGAGALLVIGFLMVYSTTFDLGFRREDNPVHFVTRQMIAMLIGVVATIILLQFDYHVLRYISMPFIFLTVGSLIYLLFFGTEEYGATRSLFNGSYQPAEAAKLATIIYISHWLHSKGDRIKQWNYGLVPFAFLTGVMFALIVLQPALSTASLVGLICLILFFVAGADLKQLLLVAVVAGVIVTLFMFTLDHAVQRINDFTLGIRDPQQTGYQVQQALIALANGGIWGKGLGSGEQKFGSLPLAHTDGVFAIVGEELGLIGSIGVVAMFAFLAWRGFRIASRARDSFGFLLATGITVWISLQALINIAVITAVFPFTGMPMPFLSYGGSSMLMVVLGVGVLLNISRDANLGRQPGRRQTGSS